MVVLLAGNVTELKEQIAILADVRELAFRRVPKIKSNNSILIITHV